jgi:hypothetical protein
MFTLHYLDGCIRFILHRQQRVKVGDVTSQWVGLNAGVPQGAWLGPLVFLVLINDLGTSMPSFKFVDDITVAEVLNNGAPSHMQEAADQIAHWSKQNYMNVNVKKTKEMLLGHLQNNPPSSILFPHGTVEQIHSFKLLGLTITDQLNWEAHVDTICKKANKRLHFLKLLKQSSMSCSDMLVYYKAVIRSVIEYACPVWQSGLTIQQRDRLEAIQRRAFAIISGSSDYELHCALFDIEPISVRLDNLARSFFQRVSSPNDCLHKLLPEPRQQDITNKLRLTTSLPCPRFRTSRYQHSFIPYA